MVDKENEPHIFQAEIYWMLIGNKINEVAAYGKDAVPALIKALGDPNPDVRWNATGALGKIGKPAVPELIIALGDPDWNATGNVTRALGKIGKPAVPALIIALADTDPNVIANALWALIEMGKPAVSALIKSLVDTDPNVKLCAAEALGNIGNERGIMFKRIIHDKDLEYAKGIGLDKVKEVMKEFIGMLWKDSHSTEAIPKIKRMEYELAEFYNKVAAEIAKKGKGISVKGGELLKDTVKAPNGNNGIYRAMERRVLRIA